MLLVNKKFPIAKSLDFMRIYTEHLYKTPHHHATDNLFNHINRHPLLINVAWKNCGEGEIVIPYNKRHFLVYNMINCRIDKQTGFEITPTKFLQRLVARRDLPGLTAHIINDEIILKELNNYVIHFEELKNNYERIYPGFFATSNDFDDFLDLVTPTTLTSVEVNS